MILFPSRYAFVDMTHWFQAKKQIEWTKFRTLLNQHFKSHFEIDPDEFECIQTHSTFRDCSLELIVEKYDDTENPPPVRGLPIFQASTLPNTARFEPRLFGAWNVMKDRFKGISTDNHTAIILLFFVPAFVWAYNELKKAIETDDRRIQLLEYWLNRHMKVVTIAKREGAPEGPPEPRMCDFTMGTGFKIRSAKYWQDFFGEEMEEVEEDAGPGASTLASAPSAHVAGQASAPCGGGQVLAPFGGGQFTLPFAGGQFTLPFAGGQVLAPFAVGAQLPMSLPAGQPYLGGQASSPYVGGQFTVPYVAGQLPMSFSAGQGAASYGGGQLTLPFAGGQGVYDQGLQPSPHVPHPHEYVAGPVYYNSVSTPAGNTKEDGSDGGEVKRSAGAKRKRSASNEAMGKIKSMVASARVARANRLGFDSVAKPKRFEIHNQCMCPP